MKNIIYKIFTIGFFVMWALALESKILHRQVDEWSNKYTQYDCVRAYDILISQKESYPNISKKEYKQKLKINRHICLDVKSNVQLGIPQINTIIIDSDLEGFSYYITLAHEKTHITTFSANEQYVCFKTFEMLYTSEDPFLKQVGITYGIKQLNDLYYNEYDVKGQIINYLLGNNIYYTID